MRQADFELLKRSGCQAIFYGVESASLRLLKDSLNKNADPELMRQVLSATKAAGIAAIASVIYPCPGEDEASRRATLEFLKEVRPDSVPVTIPGLIPGTTWAREPERFGFAFPESEALWRRAMTYQIKLLFPPAYWDPLPYTLEGKNSREFFAESAAFTKEIEAAGLLTDVAHELFLMSGLLGMEPRAFRDEARALFLSGDAERIADMVSAINAACRPVRQAAPTPLEAAGGGA
jgi:hypothetical protein